MYSTMLERAAMLPFILTALLVGCGNVKFSSNSGTSSGSEEQVDQPADVTGGLGLTWIFCRPRSINS